MFENLRNRTGKQYIKKYDGGGPLTSPTGQYRTEIGQDGRTYHNPNGFWELHPDAPTDEVVAERKAANVLPEEYSMPDHPDTPLLSTVKTIDVDPIVRREPEPIVGKEAQSVLRQQERSLRKQERADRREERQERRAERREAWEDANQGTADGTISSAINNGVQGNWGTMAADIGVAAMKSIDQVAMGDKNFGAQSEAIDSTVHGVSSALMKSGNPYAMAAGAALEGINFLTKAGGQTVQGFDVDINSSGYGQMGHMESSSSRSFLGLGNKNLEAKLQKRNAQAQMAMNAANIANEQSFEQEARMNSIQNTIMNNQMALAGGLDTSLLGG